MKKRNFLKGDNNSRLEKLQEIEIQCENLQKIINSLNETNPKETEKFQLLLDEMYKKIKNIKQNEDERIEPKNIRYSQTIYLFKRINPLKKYAKFEYTEINYEDAYIYLQKHSIIKINDIYYEFAGEKEYDWVLFS